MATHASSLAWKIPWTEELGGHKEPMGSQRAGRDRVTNTHTHTHTHDSYKLIRNVESFNHLNVAKINILLITLTSHVM